MRLPNQSTVPRHMRGALSPPAPFLSYPPLPNSGVFSSTPPPSLSPRLFLAYRQGRAWPGSRRRGGGVAPRRRALHGTGHASRDALASRRAAANFVEQEWPTGGGGSYSPPWRQGGRRLATAPQGSTVARMTRIWQKIYCGGNAYSATRSIIRRERCGHLCYKKAVVGSQAVQSAAVPSFRSRCWIARRRWRLSL